MVVVVVIVVVVSGGGGSVSTRIVSYYSPYNTIQVFFPVCFFHSSVFPVFNITHHYDQHHFLSNCVLHTAATVPTLHACEISTCVAYFSFTPSLAS